jgi:putative RecB family exonuclease
VVDYSFSKLSTYEKCPFKYKLIYIDRVARPPDQSIESFLGDKVHKAIHKAYNDTRNRKTNSLEDLVNYYRKSWERDWNENVFIVRKELTADNYKNNGEHIVESFYKRFSPFDTEVTMAAETSVRFCLDSDDRYNLTGRVDRVARAQDGAIEVHEYKTGSYLPGQYEIDRDKQLGYYHMAIQQRWPSQGPIRLVAHYLAHDTDLISYRNEADIADLVKNTIRLINEIETTRDFPARNTALCAWCEYPEYCPERKHLYSVADLPVNEYLNEPGVKLVNRYAELKEQSKTIEEELKKVKEAMVGYACNQGLSVIQGSDCYARIRTEAKYKFPGKNEPQRQSLNNLIIQNNMWMEVSELDPFALNRIIKQKAWSPEIINQVMEYCWLEDMSTVFIHKKRAENQDEE